MKKKVKKMTPEQFAKEMKKAGANIDTESRHADADDLLCTMLEQLGYKEGVKIFKAMSKWYA